MNYSFNQILKTKNLKRALLSSCVLVLLSFSIVQAQDEKTEESSDKKPAKPPFESAQFMDIQSVVVPGKKTLEFNLQHRFGTVENGSTDVWGVYGAANIRMGFSYTPIEKLAVGFGYTKFKQLLDFNVKYAIIKQRKDWSIPVSVTYFGNVVANCSAPENFDQNVHRLSFYNEVSIATRINSKISVQITPSFSHFNAVDSLYKNDMIAVAIAGRYKFTTQSAIMVSYVQQLTKQGDPNFKLQPGITLGWEIATSGHAFQIFFTNFQRILPQENIAYNTNDISKQQYLLGFNITRLWNF